MILASHNSGTGENPLNLLTWVGLPFCRCQTKTIKEQYKAGVRLFDLRVKYVRDHYYIAHGLGLFDKTLTEVIWDLAAVSKFGEPIYVMVTYEGNLGNYDPEDFIRDIEDILSDARNIVLVEVSQKLPKWETLYHKTNLQYSQDYVKIIGWKKLLPIPFIWNWFAKVTDKDFSMRDFI